jgi:hypothetical protein
VNPLAHLLSVGHVLDSLPAAAQRVIIGRQFFPDLISGPFHNGLVVVFAVSAGLSVLAGLASLLRGGRYVDPGEPPTVASARAPGETGRPSMAGSGAEAGAAVSREHMARREHLAAREHMARREHLPAREHLAGRQPPGEPRGPGKGAAEDRGDTRAAPERAGARGDAVPGDPPGTTSEPLPRGH